MSDFRKVTADFSVAGQIAVDDIRRAAADGFTLIINNRPDGEVPGQPTSAEIEAAAKAAGLGYAYIPGSGRPTPDQVREEQAVLAGAGGRTLAFCRSGNRSIITWSLGQADSGERSPAELVKLGADAGYDVSPFLGG